MSFFVTTPRKPSIAEALGTGLGRGVQTGMQAKLQSMLQQQALAQKPLTPYQQILGVQRERDLQRKVGSYIGSVLKTETLPDITPLEKARIDKAAYNLVRQGIDIPTAATQSIQDYLTKKEFLETVEVPSPSRIRKEASKNKAANVLIESGIKDPFEVRMIMQRKGWKGKDIQDVWKRIRETKVPERRITTEKMEEKVKFNPESKEHITRAREVLRQTGGNREEANKILAEEFTL